MVSHILANPRCAIWAGMGLGKTAGTLTALSALQLVEDGPTLIVAPKRVARSVWPDEAQKWEHLRHLRVIPVIGPEGARRELLSRKADIYAINYDNLPWLANYLGDQWPFTTVVSDESTRLKGFRGSERVSKHGRTFLQLAGGQRARALGRKSFSRVRRWINLTGTPSPNGLKDLWGQTWFLDQGQRLGRTYDAFKRRWFQRSFDGYSIEPLPFAQEQIQDRLRDLCLSLRSEDWFDLEQPIMNTVFVDLPPKARALYRDMERRMFMELEGSPVEAFNAAARTMKCLQIANGAAYVDEHAQTWKEIHGAKIEALESIAEEAAGVPLLVAYQFKSDLARLLKAFPGGRLLSTKKDEDDFNAGKIPLGFGHPKSMGHGLNLQHGSNIGVFFGHWWDLELYQQFIERIGPVRQMQSGYKRSVFVHHIVARNTVDELVLTRMAGKRSVQDILMEAVRRGR